MDLNYLYHRQGISLMLANAATSASARIVHEKMALEYAERIAEAQPRSLRENNWTKREAYQAFPGPGPNMPPSPSFEDFRR